MKKILIVLVALAAQKNFSQNTFPSTGSVGIGTTTPRAQLDVAKNITNELGTVFGRLQEGDGTGSGTFLGVKGYDTQGTDYTNVKSFAIIHNFYGQTNSSINFYRGGGMTGGHMTFCTSENSERMRILGNGNIGIGTTTPVSKLSVAGSLTIGGGINNASVRPLVESGTLINGEIRSLSNNGNNYDDGFLRLSAGGGTTATAKAYIDLSGYSTVPDMDRNIVFGTQGIERMRINLDGNVGIGTTTTGSHKLAVEGSIGAREVKVYTTAWADFVFKKEYTLPTLDEVEKHIKEKGHLENIPSEKEVLKDGINLGEMNAKLLQKIEEMTLYIIEQNKKNEEQSKEIESLRSLVARVVKIENELKQK